MEQSPSWEANSFSATQEILRILWNQKVHYSIYKRQPPLSILSQIDTVHAALSPFSEFHFNIILPSMHLFVLGKENWKKTLVVFYNLVSIPDGFIFFPC